MGWNDLNPSVRDSLNICFNFHKLNVFSTLRADWARLRGHRILERVLVQLQIIIKKQRPDVLALFSRFDDFSVSCNSHSKSKNRKICKNHDTTFFELTEYLWFDRFSSFNVWYKNRGPTFWHYPGHSTISQSRKITSQNAYETFGNRPVKITKKAILAYRGTISVCYSRD